MPVIQGTKKGKAKMKGSNTEKRSAGKKKGEREQKSRGAPSLVPLPALCSVWMESSRFQRLCRGSGSSRAVAFPRCSCSWQGWRALLISQARHVELSPPAQSINYHPASTPRHGEVGRAEMLLLLPAQGSVWGFCGIFRDLESEVLQALQWQCVCHLAFRLGIAVLPCIPLLGTQEFYNSLSTND